MEDAALLRHAWVAGQLYIRNRSAALCFEYAEDDIEGGSAVCVEIADRLFIATVAHNFSRLNQGVNWSVFSANRSSNQRLTVLQANYHIERDQDEPDFDQAVAAVEGELIVLDYQRAGVDINGQIVEIEPHGMSGGGVWYAPMREARPMAIWNPRRLKLLGLSREYFRYRHHLTAEPLHKWLTLLRNDLPELQAEIDPLLER